MSKPRTAWIGLAAVVAVVVIAGLGFLMMRGREARQPTATPGAPTSLPQAAAPRREGTGTAKLSWVPPGPAAAGQPDSATTDPVAGFRVYVGTSPDDLRLEASIDDPTASGYVVERLPKGTFYYSVTTVTRLGIESERPAPVSKTIE